VSFAGKAEQFARTVHVGSVHGLRVANPKAVVRGYVNDGATPSERWPERFGIGQVADVRVACNAFEVGQIAGFADQKAKLRTFGSQRARHVMADKSCCAGEEDFHSGTLRELSF
jgi:hypothetical protein